MSSKVRLVQIVANQINERRESMIIGAPVWLCHVLLWTNAVHAGNEPAVILDHIAAWTAFADAVVHIRLR